MLVEVSRRKLSLVGQNQIQNSNKTIKKSKQNNLKLLDFFDNF